MRRKRPCVTGATRVAVPSLERRPASDIRPCQIPGVAFTQGKLQPLRQDSPVSEHSVVTSQALCGTLC